MKKIALILTLAVLAAVFYFFDPALTEVIVSRLSYQHVVAAFALLAANLLIVGIRFWLLLKRFGLTVPFGTAIHANTLSQVSGLFFLPIIGQYLGRAALLGKHGAPAAMMGTITFYEKIISLGAASLLCIGGLIYLFGSAAYDLIIETTGPILPFHILALGAISYALGYRFSALHQERALMRRAVSWRGVRLTLEAAGLTIISQGCMVAAYVVIATTLPSSPPLAGLLAACAAIMFLAALPISVNGWGVRELASAYMLGQLGVAADDAIAASIALGLAALLCLLLVAGLSVAVFGASRSAPVAAAPSVLTIRLRARQDRALVAILAAVVATAIFFQIHIPVAGTATTINMADPFAILGGGLFAILWLTRRSLPGWHVPRLNLFLAAVTVVLVAAFLNGYLSFGLIPWALNNRLIGWIVILGYFFTGAAISTLWGHNGLRRLTVGIAATAVILSVYMTLSYVLPLAGLGDFGQTVFPNFGYFVPNRNALAWQLLIAFIGILAVGSRPGRYLPWIAAGLIAGGVILTGSRAGIGTLAILIAAAAVLRFVTWRQSVVLAATLAVLFAAIVAAPAIPIAADRISAFITGTAGDAASEGIAAELVRLIGSVRPSANIEASNNERLDTLMVGLEVWAQHPIMGAGLGSFVHLYEELRGKPQVIHNTGLWLLAELGLVGFMLFVAGFAVTALWSFSRRHAPGIGLSARIVLLTLLAFAAFSTVHEIMYQRIFWLVIGTALLTPEPAHSGAPFRLPEMRGAATAYRCIFCGVSGRPRRTHE